jgi:hypothetical protein
VNYPNQPVMLRPRLLVPLVAATVVASCQGGEPASPAEPPPPAAAPEEGSPPPAQGRELVGDCLKGYTSPAPGDPLRAEALRLVARAARVAVGDLRVEEIRYFEGPESPPSEREYLLNVRRWYVKATLEGDPSFAGRFLVEKRSFGAGVVAVARFDTAGLRSPDWVGFQYDEGAAPRTYPGLPGAWAGSPYDFITGRDLGTQEEIFGFPGLPVEVAGCLEGT